MNVLHYVELLDEAYRKAGKTRIDA